MRFPRFRLRTLMIAVVLVALGTTFGLRREWSRRRAQYLRLVAYHEVRWANIHEVPNQANGRTEIWIRHDPVRRQWMVSSPARKDYEARMKRKYAEAARRPWREKPRGRKSCRTIRSRSMGEVPGMARPKDPRT